MTSSRGLKKSVLSYLSARPRAAVTLKELAKKLHLSDEAGYRALRGLLHELTAEGILVEAKGGKVRYGGEKRAPRGRAGLPRRLTGVISLLRRGGGIVRADGGVEVFVPQAFLRTAFDGDTVAVVPLADRRVRGSKERLPEAEVVEVVERVATTVTGRLQEGRHFWFVIPDDERIRKDVYVSKADAMQANEGDKVVVQLQPWIDEHRNPEGKIIEVLGPSGNPRVEVLGVARRFGLQLKFPDDVEREAAAFPAAATAADLAGRLDFRKAVTFTIDPEDAKDFDDALSLEIRPDGTRRLGVHIADVSHYVREGSQLDAEAYARGTSVYLVNEVVPMLPERLSNDLCSLRPNEDRLTYSVIMDINRQGTVVSSSIRKTVIHSRRRFTYEEVQKILDAGRGEHAEHLMELNALAKQQTQRRRKAGSLDFDTGETKFRFDPEGFPTHILKKERLDAHRLVEECMLLANRTVAEQPGFGSELPFLYRIHDVPDPKRLTDLANFVKKFGFSLNVSGGVPAKELQKLLDRVKGSEVETLINEVVLRSMAKAIYSDKNIGHYGLAFRHYTHFTSPIRRYPDLVVHRLLLEYGKGAKRNRVQDLQAILPDVAAQSSMRERVAMEAERASVKVMQVEYMKRHLGDELEGVIGGVTEFGIFVEIDELLVEGLVPVRDLADDYYVFDETQYALKGRRRGKVYRLGDRVRVRVSSVDQESHRIDFSIVD